MASFWNKCTTITTGVAITLLGAYYIYQSPTSITYTMSNSSSSNGIPGLEFKLTQTSRNPPALLVTLKNNSPDTPYTLLKWGTPLDSAALNTGVFKIVNEESGDEVEQMVLQINRKMPPPQEELVTIAPGTEEELTVTFDKPWMPEQKPAKYKVKAEGEFKGVWDKYGTDISEDDLNAYIQSPFSGKRFATNEVIMEVH
ncbi:hypothetical protein HBI38_138750 [Parastagonospora nodorum]|nr:hypothetical protein HBH49_144020 [Parastagonospora nodorum]KAH4206245.1 hypothetical protein HBI95_125960 [Parastagonospora nodorum]KAH4929378.1 hypothetical protein HBI79_119750 [Parastagonospora nodorum]KAH4986044.1 hypothetical protein HBI76_119850 [Parastagonospora nodorum]KAH5158836.1 hypothetical protein HBI73_059110 [Parastagonospora nodorum]